MDGIAVSSVAVPACAGCAIRGVGIKLTAATIADVARSTAAEVVRKDIVILPAWWSMRASVDRCRFGIQ